MSVKSPVFIVGLPRSGTSLLAGILSSHPNVFCGPETHIFNKFPWQKINRNWSKQKWIKWVRSELNQLKLTGQRVMELYGVDNDELSTYLNSHPISIRSVIEAIMQRGLAGKNGNVRWAEKTPSHLLYVWDIRSIIPEAKIIRIIRDPRDCALSMRQLSWTYNNELANLYFCNQWHKASYQFFLTDKKCLTIYYEDLVASPNKTLIDLFDFIEEDFLSEVLRDGKQRSKVASPNEVWKKGVSEDITTSKVYSWKKELNYLDELTMTYASYSWLKMFEYEVRYHPKQQIQAWPINLRDVKLNVTFFKIMAIKGVRLYDTKYCMDKDLLVLLDKTNKNISKKSFKYFLSDIKTILLTVIKKKICINLRSILGRKTIFLSKMYKRS